MLLSNGNQTTHLRKEARRGWQKKGGDLKRNKERRKGKKEET